MMNVGSEAGEKVTLFNQRHEVQAELQGSRFDANPCVNHATCHAQRDGNMGVLDVFGVAKHDARLNGMLMKKMIDEHPGTGSRLAIHKAQTMTHKVREFVNQRRMLPAHHQSLRSPGAGDQLMKLGLEPGLKCPGENRRPS